MNFLRKFKLPLFLLLVFAVSCYLQFANPEFPDPDPYFHMKVAELIRQGAGYHDFPWMQFTIHKTYYAESVFLPHLVAAGLQNFADPVTVQKLLCALAATAVAAALYFLLKRSAVPHALLWTAWGMFGSYIFLFRLNMGRIFGWSILLLLLIYYVCATRRYWLLFLLSALYVLTYSAFPLIILMGMVFAATDWLVNRRLNWRVLLAILAGLALGIVLHPSFPNNLAAYYTYLVAIPFGNGLAFTGAGTEWMPLGINVILLQPTGLLLPLLAFLFSLPVLFWAKNSGNKQKSEELFFAAGTAFIYFLTMLKSVRFLEYWLPFATFFTALALKYFWDERWPRLAAQTRTPPTRKLTLWGAAGFASIAVFNIFLVNGMLSAPSLSGGTYRGAAEYLRTRAQPGQLVFNTHWEQFPYLFYYNARNYYVVGMDPTFMYIFDKQKYWLWQHLADDAVATCAKPVCAATDSKTPLAAIKDDFGAAYVLVEEAWNPRLKKALDQSSGLEKVYQDAKTSLFRVN
jgi:hypothetical protein